MARFHVRKVVLPILLILLVEASSYQTQHESKDGNNCPNEPSWDMLLKQATLQFSSTIEVIFRSFALGFGAHLLQYLLFKNNEATYEELAARFRVSAICGLAMASCVFGSSVLIPVKFRLHWFEY